MDIVCESGGGPLRLPPAFYLTKLHKNAITSKSRDFGMCRGDLRERGISCNFAIAKLHNHGRQQADNEKYDVHGCKDALFDEC